MTESYKEVMKQIESLQSKAVELKNRERVEMVNLAKSLIQEAKTIAKEYDIKFAELGLAVTRITTYGKKATRATGVTKTVAPKYISPDGANTWTGRGMKPRWLADALATGKTAEMFLIKADA
jgi:DNA-binding protein H-NS